MSRIAMNMPNTMKMKANSLRMSIASALAGATGRAGPPSAAVAALTVYFALICG